jgi:PKD repeat protein
MPGSFDVTVTVTDLITGCRRVAHPGPVIVHATPEAVPTAVPNPACPGRDVLFGATPQGAGPFTWDWDFGDGTTSQLDTPTHAFAAPGPQDVTVTLVDVATGCSFTKPLAVTVLTPAAPTACVAPLASRCEATLDGPTVIPLASCSDLRLVHAWSTTLGTIDDPSALSPQLTLPDVSTSTPVTVTLDVIDPADPCGGHATTTTSFDLRPLPRAVIRALPAPACAGEIVNFSASPSQGVGPYAHAWDFGDGDTSTAASPTHVYAVGGPRVVRVTLTDLATACVTVLEPVSLDVLTCNPNTCLYRVQVSDRLLLDRLATFIFPPTPQGISLQGAALRCPFQSGDADANAIGDGMGLTFYQVDDPLRVMTLSRSGSDIRFIF